MGDSKDGKRANPLVIDHSKKNRRHAKGLGAKQGYETKPAVGASPIDLLLFPGLAVQFDEQFVELQRAADEAQHRRVVLDN